MFPLKVQVKLDWPYYGLCWLNIVIRFVYQDIISTPWLNTGHLLVTTCVQDQLVAMSDIVNIVKFLQVVLLYS